MFFFWPGLFSRLCPDCIAELFTPKPKHTNDEPSATRLIDFKRELDVVRTEFQRKFSELTTELRRRVREKETSIPEAWRWFHVEVQPLHLERQWAIEQLELRFGLCWVDYLEGE